MTNTNDTILKNEYKNTILNFENILGDLYKEISKNRAERQNSLCESDMKLLRRTEAAIVYISTYYEDQWKICLTKQVVQFILEVTEILGRTYAQVDKEYVNKKDYMSILDVKTICDQAQEIIRYITNDFNPDDYVPRWSPVDALKTFLSRNISSSKPQEVY